MQNEITPETLEEYTRHYYHLHDALIEQTEIRISGSENKQCDFEITLSAMDATIQSEDNWTTLILRLQNVKKFDLVKQRSWDFSVILRAGLDFFDGNIYLSLFGEIDHVQNASELGLRRHIGKEYLVAAEKCFWEVVPHDYDRENGRLNATGNVIDFYASDPETRHDLSPDSFKRFREKIGPLRRSQIQNIIIAGRRRRASGYNARITIEPMEWEGKGVDYPGTLIFEAEDVRRFDLTSWGRHSTFPHVDEVNAAFYLDEVYLSFTGMMGSAIKEHPDYFDDMAYHNGKKIAFVSQKSWWRSA